MAFSLSLNIIKTMFATLIKLINLYIERILYWVLLQFLITKKYSNPTIRVFF